MGDYKNIKDPGRAKRMGGLKQYILVAPYSWFTALQKPASGVYNIATAHTFATGKGWIKLYLTQDTGMIKFDTQGGADRKSFKVEGEAYHPGESDEINNFGNECKNDRFIVLAPLPGSDVMIQAGNDEFQIAIDSSYDTTKNSGDGRGWMFKLSGFAADMVTYTGTVTMLADPA